MLAGIGEAASVIGLVQVVLQLADKIRQISVQLKIEDTKRTSLIERATDLLQDLRELSDENGNPLVHDGIQLQKIRSALEGILDGLEKKNRSRIYGKVPKAFRISSIIKQLEDAKGLVQDLSSDVVEKGVITINKRMPKFSVCVPSLPTHIVVSEGMKAVFDFLEQDEAGIEVRVAGISGEGGMGKTTLLNWTVAQLWEQTGAMLVPYVEVGMDPDLDKLMRLQSSIAQQLGSSEVKLQSIHHGQALIKQQLEKVRARNKKACLAIDNVWQVDDLTKLLPTDLGSCLPPSSCILLTTRSLEVVEKLEQISKAPRGASPGIQKRCEFRYFDMLQLSEEDATQLFRKHACLADDHHCELVGEVVRRCGGHPLCLEVLGAHFAAESKRIQWKEFVQRMDSPSETPASVKKVEQVLRFSYDRLSADAQKAFVDVATYFHGWDWDTIRCIFGNDEIEELRHSCLLKEVNFEGLFRNICGMTFASFKCGKMHDRVRSLGRSLAKGNRLQTDDREKVLLDDNVDRDLHHQIEGFWQRGIEYHGEVIIGGGALGGMQNLRVLCASIEGTFAPGRSLRYLDLDCGDEDWELPMRRCQQLSVVSLRRLAWDFSGANFPKHLRQLHLHDCGRLVELRIDSLEKLEVLHLHGCLQLQRISLARGEFERLLKLEITHAPRFVELPLSLGTSLQSLYLRGCTSLASLPETLGKLTSLQSLDLGGCTSLASLPETLGKLTSLQSLDLEGCTSLALER